MQNITQICVMSLLRLEDVQFLRHVLQKDSPTALFGSVQHLDLAPHTLFTGMTAGVGMVTVC